MMKIVCKHCKKEIKWQSKDVIHYHDALYGREKKVKCKCENEELIR